MMTNLADNRNSTRDEEIPSSCDDINEIFDSIAFSENNIVSTGFEEGFEKGKTTGELEGYHLGYHRGAEIGAELGYYKGVIGACMSVTDESLQSRHKITIEKLNELIDSFPKTNDENIDIVTMRDNIRSIFKKLCSLLKVEVKSPEEPGITF